MVKDMVLFPRGYASVDKDNSVTFHYHIQNYLGNNWAVVNGSTGAIEQTTAYYPYGGVIPELSTGMNGQPYKFGGKELISENGINEYDFGARRYWSAVPQFTSVDPLSEKFKWLSPYRYCASNPVNLIDRDGKDIWIEGQAQCTITCKWVDIMIAVENDKVKVLLFLLGCGDIGIFLLYLQFQIKPYLFI